MLFELEKRYEHDLELRAKLLYFTHMFYSEFAQSILEEKRVKQSYDNVDNDRCEFWSFWFEYKEPVLGISKRFEITIEVNGVVVGRVSSSRKFLESYLED